MITKRPALLSFALLPLIAPQGLYVKFRAAQMPEPPGPRAGLTGSGRDLRLLVLGDSSAAGVGVATQSEALAGQIVAELAPDFRVNWRLQAEIGATSQSTYRMLDQVPPGRFDVVVTALGVNDVKNGVSLGNWMRRQRRLYTTLIDRFDPQVICCSGMPPVRDFPLLPQPLRWALQERANVFDAAHRGIIDTIPQCHYLKGPPRLDPAEMAADGFHPGAAVYHEWAVLAAALIRATLPDPRPAPPEA